MYYDNDLYGTAGLLQSSYVALRSFNACGTHVFCQIGEVYSPSDPCHFLGASEPAGGGQRLWQGLICQWPYLHPGLDLTKSCILVQDYLLKDREDSVFSLGNGVGFIVKEAVDVVRKVTIHPIPAKIDRAGSAILPSSSLPPKRTSICEVGGPSVQRLGYHCGLRLGLA